MLFLGTSGSQGWCQLWESCSLNSPFLSEPQLTCRTGCLLTLVSLPQVLSLVAILQMSKVRRRELRNPESCRIEDLSHVAVGYSRMGILSQWTRVGSIMVGEPSMGVMSRHPSREDCTETLAAGSRDSTWAPGGAGGSE